MNDLWKILQDSLNELLSLHQVLLQFSQRKRDVLVTHNIQDLETVTKQMEVLILKIGKAAMLVDATVKKIASTAQSTSEQQTIEKILVLAEPAVGDSLTGTIERMRKLAEEIRKVNDVNTKLVQQALFFVDCSVNLLSRNALNPTYASRGRQASTVSKNPVFIDHKA